MKDKLAIFDLDGTLFDTRAVNYQAYRDAILECGYPFDCSFQNYCQHYCGMHYLSFLSSLFDSMPSSEQKRIHARKLELYSRYLSSAVQNTHLFSVIESLSSTYIIALATTGSRRNTGDILKHFDVIPYFDIILTQEDVTELKPSPQCFQLAMAQAHVSPENTLIFEDSETGLSAARQSGAKYLRVYGFN